MMELRRQLLSQIATVSRAAKFPPQISTSLRFACKALLQHLRAIVHPADPRLDESPRAPEFAGEGFKQVCAVCPRTLPLRTVTEAWALAY